MIVDLGSPAVAGADVLAGEFEQLDAVTGADLRLEAVEEFEYEVALKVTKLPAEKL